MLRLLLAQSPSYDTTLVLPLATCACLQGASALFDMIEYYESATHLNISFNKHIGTRGWQAAAHMMRKVGTSQADRKPCGEEPSLSPSFLSLLVA